MKKIIKVAIFFLMVFFVVIPSTVNATKIRDLNNGELNLAQSDDGYSSFIYKEEYGYSKWIGNDPMADNVVNGSLTKQTSNILFSSFLSGVKGVKIVNDQTREILSYTTFNHAPIYINVNGIDPSKYTYTVYVEISSKELVPVIQILNNQNGLFSEFSMDSISKDYSNYIYEKPLINNIENGNLTDKSTILSLPNINFVLTRFKIKDDTGKVVMSKSRYVQYPRMALDISKLDSGKHYTLYVGTGFDKINHEPALIEPLPVFGFRKNDSGNLKTFELEKDYLFDRYIDSGDEPIADHVVDGKLTDKTTEIKFPKINFKDGDPFTTMHIVSSVNPNMEKSVPINEDGSATLDVADLDLGKEDISQGYYQIYCTSENYQFKDKWTSLMHIW